MTRRAALALIALVAIGCRGDGGEPLGPAMAKRPFQPDRLKPEPELAIGELRALPPDVQAALDPTHDYRPAPVPHGNDWLITNPEPGQTFAQFLRDGSNRPDGERRVLYLLPLGELPADRTPPMADLIELVHAFYQLEVKVLPAVAVEDVHATTRLNRHTVKPQLLAPDVLRWMTSRVPADAYAVMAVTMADLYPDPEWNFVYGQATFVDRVGVQSFARYDPAFFDEPRPADWHRTLVRRSAQVVVHELGHMFGIAHCIHWDCVMAGANHQEEFDKHPLHVCPVDLRKLWWAVGFDVAAREAALAAVWARLGQDDEAAWSAARATRLRAPAR